MSNLKMIGLTAIALIVAGLWLGFMSVKGASGHSCGSPFNPNTYLDQNYDESCKQSLSSAERAPTGLLLVGGILGFGAVLGALMEDKSAASSLRREGHPTP